MPRYKVFGLGFHRTGTTTLQTSLEELGHKVVGMRERDWSAFEEGDHAAILRTIDEHDGFRDMPWPLMYEWIDRNVPDARFVLTTRSTESWIRSCRAFYRKKPYRMFPTIYGFDAFAGNEAIAAAVYERHIAQVREYFAGRPDRFVEVDFSRGDGWAAICNLLGERVPQRAFPRANVGAFSLSHKVRRKLLMWFAPNLYFRVVRDLR